MIEVLFYFVIFLIIGLLTVGYFMHNGSVVAIAGVLAILIGALFISGEGIELQKPNAFAIQDVNADYTTATVGYTTIGSADSFLLLMIQYLFFVGGFGLLIYALLISARTPPAEQIIEETIVE